MPSALYYIIISICLLEYAYDVLIYKLNRKASKNPIPEELLGLYDADAYARQQEYGRMRSRLGLIDSTVGTVVLLSLFATGCFGIFDGWVSAGFEGAVLQALAFFGIIFLLSWLPEQPFGIYSTFKIEAKFGFNRTTPKTYLLDIVKELLLSVIMGGGILSLLVWLYGLMPDIFWIVAWGAMTIIMLFMQYIYSDVIVPLFNKQTPLEEGELRSAIQQFADKVGFKLKDIYVIDGSKRSSHANAYFTGYGARKRIVLYDTLMEQLTTEEIVGVLAHEIGHYKHGHIWRGIISSLLTNLVMFLMLGWVLDSVEIAQAAGADRASFHVNIMVFSLLYTPLSVVLGIVDAFISRRHEWQADEFARLHGVGTHVASALKKMSAKSLSNLTPHPWVVKLKYSHPTLLERVRHLGCNKE